MSPTSYLTAPPRVAYHEFNTAPLFVKLPTLVLPCGEHGYNPHYPGVRERARRLYYGDLRPYSRSEAAPYPRCLTFYPLLRNRPTLFSDRQTRKEPRHT